MSTPDHTGSPLPPWKPKGPPTWFTALKVFGITLVILFLTVAFLLPQGGRPRAASDWIQCASNLRKIGLAAKMYANQSPEPFPFPSDFATMLATRDITSDVFCCPADKVVTRAVGPTTQSIAAQIDVAGLRHCSYVWAGRGLTDTAPVEDVLAFESPSNHDGNGFNVLFADGHVDQQDCRAGTANEHVYEHLQADFAAGVRPLRLRPLRLRP